MSGIPWRPTRPILRLLEWAGVFYFTFPACAYGIATVAAWTLGVLQLVSQKGSEGEGAQEAGYFFCFLFLVFAKSPLVVSYWQEEKSEVGDSGIFTSMQTVWVSFLFIILSKGEVSRFYYLMPMPIGCFDFQHMCMHAHAHGKRDNSSQKVKKKKQRSLGTIPAPTTFSFSLPSREAALLKSCCCIP